MRAQAVRPSSTIADRIPVYVAVVHLAFWLLIFAFLWHAGQLSWQKGLSALWLVYNVTGWLVPKWRLVILGRRHGTVGLGFAIAGSLMTTLALASEWRMSRVLLQLVLYAALLYVPFLAIQGAKVRPGRPHPLDLFLAAYVAYLAYRWPLDRQLLADGNASLGGFAAFALAVTLFLGARLWNRTRLEFHIPRRHVGVSLGAAAAVLVALGADSRLRLGNVASAAWLDNLYHCLVLAPLVALLLFGVGQVTLRELLKPRGLNFAEAVSALVCAGAACGVWYGHFSALHFTGIVVATSSAWLLYRTKAWAPVALVHVLGYLLIGLIM